MCVWGGVSVKAAGIAQKRDHPRPAAPFWDTEGSEGQSQAG